MTVSVKNLFDKRYDICDFLVGSGYDIAFNNTFGQGNPRSQDFIDYMNSVCKPYYDNVVVTELSKSERTELDFFYLTMRLYMAPKLSLKMSGVNIPEFDHLTRESIALWYIRVLSKYCLGGSFDREVKSVIDLHARVVNDDMVTDHEWVCNYNNTSHIFNTTSSSNTEDRIRRMSKSHLLPTLLSFTQKVDSSLIESISRSISYRLDEPEFIMHTENDCMIRKGGSHYPERRLLETEIKRSFYEFVTGTF